MDATFIAKQDDGLLLLETWDTQARAHLRELAPYKQQALKVIKQVAEDSMIRSYPLLGNSASYKNDGFGNISFGIIESDRKTFHYSVGDALVLLLMCDRTFSKQLAFSYLQELRSELMAALESANPNGDPQAEIARQMTMYSFIRYERIVLRLNGEYRDPRSHTAVKKLHRELNEVTGIMRRNITEILQRGENLEDVSKKAEDLRLHSEKFSSLAKRMNRFAWMQKYGPFALVGTLLVMVILWVVF